MYNLSDEEKLKFIREKAEELLITAYEFGKETDISTLGAQNILDGKSKNPRTKNLNIMLQYIESKEVGKSVVGHHNYRVEDTKAEETESKYINMQDLADLAMKYHDEIMNIQLYKLFFETKAQERAIEILKNLKQP